LTVGALRSSTAPTDFVTSVARWGENMKRYHHTQPAPSALMLLVLVILAILAAATFAAPQSLAGLLVACVIVVTMYYCFRSLTVEVSDEELSWYFGSGFWRKRILLSEVARVEPVRIPWWMGSGIHYFGNWFYCIVPGDGIKVYRKDGRVVIIGTDDRTGLLAALNVRHS
jgi:hypothetical protein